MDISGDSVAIRGIIILILLGLSAFFSSSETALTTVSKIRMRSLAESGNKAARWVLKLDDNKSKMLSAILVGNNVVNLSASALMTVLASEIFGNAAVGAATGILTVLILIFGEITPKTMAALEAERIALRVGHPIYLLTTLLTPVIWLINKLSGGILYLFQVDPNKKGEELTEAELRTIVEVGHEKGVIESDEKEIINNVFDLGDLVASDVMVPRVNMVLINIGASCLDLLELYRKEQYTRIPVYQDSTDNIVGWVNIKDMLLEEHLEDFSIRNHLRSPLYTFEAKSLSDLMIEMRKTSNNIAIVLDEYGATAGLITLEDILEEIVGDIQDEYDMDEAEGFRSFGHGVYLVDGAMSLSDLDDRLHLDLHSEEYDSVGGLMIEKLDHIPVQGEAVMVGDIRLLARSVKGNRIEKVCIQLPHSGQEGEQS